MWAYTEQELTVDGILASQLVAEFGTPLYVYAAQTIRQNCQAWRTAFSELQPNTKPNIHYSVKANSNLAILQYLKAQGLGFDIVSGGELARLQAIEANLQDVSFAGVGKTTAEISDALQAGVGFFNVESAAELIRIAGLAQSLQKPARILLRLNPNVAVDTHHYITTGRSINKFGIAPHVAHQLCQQFQAHPWVDIVGLHLHIGSQIKTAKPYVQAAQIALDFIQERRQQGHIMQWLNLGGGAGIAYQDDDPLSPQSLAETLWPHLRETVREQSLQLIFEPGRSIIASAGVLLTRVQYLKDSGNKHFIIVDSGMHHLIRPALYQGWHKIWPINQAEPGLHAKSQADLQLYDVVGPICESTDFLAKDRPLPPVQADDVLAVFNAGAYGFVMASHYNSHPRPAEILVDGETYYPIRRKESYADMLAPELHALK